MTESNQPPAQEAISSASTTALSADAGVPASYFIPQGTRDNYVQIARDRASLLGGSAKSVLEEMAAAFARQHEAFPLDGYDHLARWAAEHDPDEGGTISGLAVLQARALESARRDPSVPVFADQALVEVAVAAQVAADEQTSAASAAPSVDPSSGLLPNSGPLPQPSAEEAGAPASSPSEGEQVSAPSAGNESQTASTPSDSASSSSSSKSSSKSGSSE